MTASYPSSVKSFTTKTDGVDDVLAEHVNSIQDEVTAIENDLTTGTFGNYDAFQARLVTDEARYNALNSVGGTNGLIFVTGSYVGIGTPANSSYTLDVTGTFHGHGDVYTVGWTDYSATSTIVGWTSYTSKVIKYKKIGKLVFVMMNIQGTSDNTATTFTLPYTASTTMYNAIYSMNNGTEGIGYVGATASSATITCYYGPGFGTWTASGNKRCVGQFFYEEA